MRGKKTPIVAIAYLLACRVARVFTMANTYHQHHPLTTIRAMNGAHFEYSSTPSMTDTTTSASAKVNLLDLAAAAVACTVTASEAIRRIARPEDNAKNTRLKEDGSFVTDADFAAQSVIFHALLAVCPDVRIVGEESAEDVARQEKEEAEKKLEHDPSDDGLPTALDEAIFQRTRREIFMRYHQQRMPSRSWPLAPRKLPEDDPVDVDPIIVDDALGSDTVQDPDNFLVDVSRVAVVVDPLDGTKSYAHGDYDCVSILIAIILDSQPHFGVIGKPFGYAGLSPILDTDCAAVYGGPFLRGVFVAGGDAITVRPIAPTESKDDLPRAVISGSRSKGVVHDFCSYLGEKGLVYPEPMLISGAGEKSLRLILQTDKQALWFYPKSGTSLWDVAAPDALLRVLGGKLTDKFGHEMDYSRTRANAENVDGVVACIDAKLHADCIRLFQEGDWAERT